MYAKRSARVALGRSWPDLGVPVPLLCLRVLLELFAVLARESVGDVRALPRLGLGLADRSRLGDS